jgi:hypothetical protein
MQNEYLADLNGLIEEESKALSDELYPAILDKKERQMLTYREAYMPSLFNVETVRLEPGDFEMPGGPSRRIICARCGGGRQRRQKPFGHFESHPASDKASYK